MEGTEGHQTKQKPDPERKKSCFHPNWVLEKKRGGDRTGTWRRLMTNKEDREAEGMGRVMDKRQ